MGAGAGAGHPLPGQVCPQQSGPVLGWPCTTAANELSPNLCRILLRGAGQAEPILGHLALTLRYCPRALVPDHFREKV